MAYTIFEIFTCGFGFRGATIAISKLFHPGSSGQFGKTPNFFLFTHFGCLLEPMIKKKSSGHSPLEQMKSP
jgi:hypothetical protein